MADGEWQELVDHFGGIEAGFNALAEDGSSGLNIVFGGYRAPNGKFGRIGALGGYWTSKEKSQELATGVNFDGYYGKIDFSDSLKVSAAFF